MRTTSIVCWRADTRALLAAAVLLAGLVSGCAEEKDGEIPEPVVRATTPVMGPDGEVVAECDQAADGTPCGERGRGTHCLFNVCVRNACGDGIRAEEEECDDGNERDGDSCSKHCMLENCGNGAIDLGEECDDGNSAGRDGCSARCRVERCGNRVIDPGEECDDGNTRDDDICSSECKSQMLKAPDAGPADPGTPNNPQPTMDSGSSGMDAGGGMDTGTGSADTGSATDTGSGGSTDTGPIVTIDAGPADLSDQRSAACKRCMESEGSSCRDYQGTGTDLVAGCFNASDLAAAKRCSDAFFCSLNARDLCAGDLVRGPAASCYCGLDRTIDDCFAQPGSGPAVGPVGACIPQWEAATGCRAGDSACVRNALVIVPSPSGFANYLTGCAVQESDCRGACWDGGLIRDPDAGIPDAGAPDAGTP